MSNQLIMTCSILAGCGNTQYDGVLACCQMEISFKGCNQGANQTGSRSSTHLLYFLNQFLRYGKVFPRAFKSTTIGPGPVGRDVENRYVTGKLIKPVCFSCFEFFGS